MNRCHIVTRGSDDGTFHVGDHIVFYDNGDIGCVEAKGFITASDSKKAVKGMLSTEIEQRRRIAWCHPPVIKKSMLKGDKHAM